MNGVDVVILMLCVGASLAAAVCFVLAAVEARSVCKCGRCRGEDPVEGTAAMVGGVSVRQVDLPSRAWERARERCEASRRIVQNRGEGAD